MGNKQSYENGKKLLSINETEYGVLLHVVDMNHNHNEHLRFVETKYSKVGTFTYFKLSNNLSKIINNGVSFNITIYKKGTNNDKCVTISRDYRLIEGNDYFKKENVINKVRYYDYTPRDSKEIILRHDSKMNLVQIILFGCNLTN